jgi:hypothetical protein
VHNIALDSRGNVFTTEVYEGKQIQRWKVVSGAPQRCIFQSTREYMA